MAEPFLGEIRMMGFNYNPRDWALCDGGLLTIDEYPALYSLLGSQFGGDGQTSFALPDLRGRSPICIGNYYGNTYSQYYFQGERGGQEFVTLTKAELPMHTHQMLATNHTGDSNNAVNNVSILAKSDADGLLYSDDVDNLVNLAIDSVSVEGGGLGHNNVQPTQVINFCIALVGIYPPRN